MKWILPIVLALAVIGLAVVLYNTKQDDATQHQTDLGTVADYSNHLVSAQALITDRDATIVTFSNQLSDSWSATLSVSNHLVDAESTNALDLEKIAGLNHDIADGKSQNQALDHHATALTNQLAGLSKQLIAIQDSLAQTNAALAQLSKDYVLLESRLRMDAGERTLAERRFNNVPELQAQLEKLKISPAAQVSPERILAGLDIEVRSNGTYHVTAPE